MKIGKCIYEDIGPFVKAEVDFSFAGLTTVEGLVLNDPFANDNGAGKSYLFSGIHWCLYGEALEADRCGDGVIRTGAPWARMTTSVLDAANVITVRRYRRHPEYGNRVTLNVNGKDRTAGTDAQTQVEIERLLGMDFTASANRLFFGARQEEKAFFSAPESQRKAILDSLMEMDLYTQGEVRAKSLRQEQQVVQQRRALLLESQQRAVEVCRNTLEVLQRQPVQNLQTELDRIQREVRQAEKDQQRLEVNRQNLNTQMLQVQGAHADRQKAHGQRVAEWEKACREYNNSMGDRRKELLEVERELGRTEEQLQSLTSGAKNCPTCGQPIVRKVSAKDIAATRKKAKSLGVRADSIQMQLELEQRTPPEKPEAPDDREYRELEFKLREVTSAIREKVSSVQAAKRQQADIERQQREYAGRVAEAQAALAIVVEAVEATGQEGIASQQDLADWDIVVEALGNRGVKSFLMEAQLPEINRIACAYASRLLGACAEIKLEATTTLKSGALREKLSADAVLKNRAQTHGQASASQKRKLDLSLLLAFRDVRTQRSAKPFDQFFADELFDNLDRVGTERVIEMLKETAKKCPVILVTHSDRLRQIGDRRIRVTHDAATGKSAVETL